MLFTMMSIYFSSITSRRFPRISEVFVRKDFFQVFLCLLQIVFPNGSIDPWHALGIVRNVSATEQAVYIQGMKGVTGRT